MLDLLLFCYLSRVLKKITNLKSLLKSYFNFFKCFKLLFSSKSLRCSFTKQKNNYFITKLIFSIKTLNRIVLFIVHDFINKI